MCFQCQGAPIGGTTAALGFISCRSGERCAGSMARWFKEHLGFKTTKAPPPAPPKPDYRHFHTAVSSLQTPPGTGLLSAQPDILTAYKLQKELDFEDPYTPGGTVPFSTGPSSAAEVKYVSPKHRLIKVETVKAPCSPPADPEDGPHPIRLIILEDYADPFDAADQAGGTQTVTEKPTENDGYMEPYEAQKMMAEIRGGRAPKDGPVRQLPLYDTPYEPEENGGDPDGCVCSRESRLPQDDERPPEEYDQPWEWKKDRISKAFAGSPLPYPSAAGNAGRFSPYGISSPLSLNALFFSRDFRNGSFQFLK
uniref:Src homology 2 domain containing F n=1 Tax=Cyprinus carpio TaxID=7962 RepID=A0A8C2F7Q5_CYPCA